MQLRLATEGEADLVLSMICQAFGLDHDAAHPIYFHDPLFDQTQRWLLFDGEYAVSTATVVPAEMQMGGWFTKCAGIAGVCTRPALQGRGHGRELFEQLLPSLRSLGYQTAALLAENPKLYQSVGFGQGGIRWTVRVAVPGEQKEIAGEAPAAIRDQYVEHALPRLGAIRRDKARWTNVLTNNQVTSLGEGYLVWKERDDHILVKELVPPGPTPELLELFSGRELEICGWRQDMDQWRQYAISPTERSDLFYFRVLDVDAVLKTHGRFVAVNDPLIPQNTVQGGGESITIAEFSESLIRGPSKFLNLPAREFSLYLCDQF